MRRPRRGRSPAHGDRRSVRRGGVHIPVAREIPNSIEVVTSAQGAQAEHRFRPG